MHSTALIAVVSAIAGSASAFIRFPCANRLVEERADPIIFPGITSPHVHKIAGGSGFKLTMSGDDARSSKCSSCPIKQDLSNYWTPKLYYQYPNGSFQSVPTVGDNLNDENGGMTIYYFQRGPAADTKTLVAFPKDFRMLAGSAFSRSFAGDYPAQAINFHCLGVDKDETNEIPNYNCPGGLRAQVYFPSCWDGKNLDSSDHKSHVSYPSSGTYNNGPCPSTHPKQFASLFYEILYDINQFKDMWYGNRHPFVFAHGDATGYGFHGDFLNGWDIPTLQSIINDCDNVADQGVLEKCPIIQQYSVAEQRVCRLSQSTPEKVNGLLDSLPGCNPVTKGPEDGPRSPKCDSKTAAFVQVSNGTTPSTTTGTASTNYKDITSSKGWSYIGCGTDSSSNGRTLTGTTTVYSATAGKTMTVEKCVDLCKNAKYTYAGLEYGDQCFCGNSLPSDRAPKDGILGNCNMPCKGDSSETCGGADAISLYQACASGSECKNAL